MKFEKWESKLESFTKKFSRFIEWIGFIGILLMFSVNFIDVLGAKLFLWPVPGATEVIGFAQMVAIAPPIAVTLLLNRHIRVEFILMRFPESLRGILTSLSSFFSLVIFSLLLWQSLLYGQSLQRAGEIGSTSRIPFYPFAYFLAFCCFPVCLAFFLETIKSLLEVFHRGSR